MFIQQQERDTVILLVMSIFASYAFGMAFVVCEFGQRLTDAFNEINDSIETFDWYLFPLELQQMLSIILMVTQQPVELKCFGSISSARENSKKVRFHSNINYSLILIVHPFF